MAVTGLFVLLGFLLALAAYARWQGWIDAGDRLRTAGPSGDFRYRATPLLVNGAERAAWDLLHEMPLGAHAVCPKVPLRHVVRAEGEDWLRQMGRTGTRYVDFLLVDAAWRPMLAVEVDGSDRRWTAAQAKDRILSAAGVPVVHLRIGTDWRAQLSAWAEGAARRAGGARR